MALNGDTRFRLIEALQSAFPARRDLLTLADSIDVRREQFDSPGDALVDTVRALVAWADSHERVDQLVVAAKKLNNENDLLKAFEFIHAPELETDSPTAAISVCTITKRTTPLIRETIESLKNQSIQIIEYIIVDGYYHARAEHFAALIASCDAQFAIRHLPPKPTRWGPLRPAISNARNTCFLWAEGDLIVELDDCCTYLPTDFLERHVAWSLKGFAVSGSWTLDGFHDPRMDEYLQPADVGPGHFYSANRSYPLKKALEVNGYEELFDGEQGNEDIVFSHALSQAGVRFKYDPTLEVRFDSRVHTLTQLSPDPRKRRWGKEPWAINPKTRIMDDGTPHYANEWLTHEILVSGTRIETGNKFVLEELRRLTKERADDLNAVQERLRQFVDPNPCDWRDDEPLSEMFGGEFAHTRDRDALLTTDPIHSAAISQDTAQIVLVAGKVLQRQTLTFRKTERIELEVRPGVVAVTPLTRRLVVTVARRVRIYGNDLAESVELAGNLDQVQAVDCTADEQFVAAGGWDAAVHVWDLATNERICSFDDLADSVTALRFHPRSNRLVCTTASGHAYVWDVAARETIVTASLSSRSCSVLAPFIQGSATSMLCGFSDGRVVITDVETLQSTELTIDATSGQRVAAHEAEVTTAAVDEGGRFALTGSSAGDIVVWDLHERSIVQRISLSCAPVAAKLDVARRRISVVTSLGYLATWHVNPQFRDLDAIPDT